MERIWKESSNPRIDIKIDSNKECSHIIIKAMIIIMMIDIHIWKIHTRAQTRSHIYYHRFPHEYIDIYYIYTRMENSDFQLESILISIYRYKLSSFLTSNANVWKIYHYTIILRSIHFIYNNNASNDNSFISIYETHIYVHPFQR